MSVLCNECYSRIPKIGAIASSRRVQTTWHWWRPILACSWLLVPYLGEFFLFKKCENYVHSFCINVWNLRVCLGVLIYCAWRKYSALYFLARHIKAVLNLHKFDLFAVFEWANWVAHCHQLPYFCSFCHSFPQCLKMLKLPCCAGRPVINAKESDSCQTASVMAFVRPL